MFNVVKEFLFGGETDPKILKASETAMMLIESDPKYSTCTVKELTTMMLNENAHSSQETRS